MKAFIFLITSICLNVSAIAQQSDSIAIKKKLYVGLGFSTVSHHLYYQDYSKEDQTVLAFFAPLSINLGYKINERASVQIGAAYGGSTDHVKRYPNSKDTLVDTRGKTHVLAMPVTARYVFLRLFRQLPIYGTATLMPAFGTTKTVITETNQGNTTTILNTRESGMNPFFTAGLGLSYKISKSFSGFFEYHAFKYNLTGRNSAFYDWDYGTRGFEKFYRSVGLGVNYDLKRKDM